MEEDLLTFQNACQFEQIAIHASNDTYSFPAIINGIIASELFLRTLLKKRSYQSVDENSHNLSVLFSLLEADTQHKIMAGAPSINVPSILATASSVPAKWSDFNNMQISSLLFLLKSLHGVCNEYTSMPAASGRIQVYTPDKAAEILAVSAQTVRTWLQNGVLRGSKLGPRLWRITDDDIKQFLDDNKKG